jgi:hypothetical protein
MYPWSACACKVSFVVQYADDIVGVQHALQLLTRI